MFSHLLFDCVLLMLLLLTSSLKGAYVSQVGQNADLPCTYSPATTENLVPVCWGKGPCPVFDCYSLVLRTDGRNVTYQTSSRYLLKRDLHKGDVTLTIKNVTLADSGTYCCRIQFPGLMNDRKSNLELIIKPASSLRWFLTLAKVTPAWTPWRDITTAFPRMLTTKGPVSETRTLETLHDKNQTEISTLATELQDMGATTRTGLYIGAGVSAGLALILISGGLILKWYSDRNEKIQNSSLITLANLSPSGLANTAAEGMHPVENIYIIEENVYEVEDPYECYCSVNSGQQS
ncbi:hepatitis A virus cellular receptor 2 isoform X3 [Bubalus bubalis]|uniref:hepatitis A virus cellular receptor 2 isoform X3 n=1 Tax=Bubalus bubalis TaxID=89462 RepID=UPI001E1B65A8|nr:hepatitis A virus cellular receptor 2 isoform X3 [Bubalus bubalis]